MPRMILALPLSQSDNNNDNNNNNNDNNSATFVRLPNTNPESPRPLSAARNITDGWILLCHCYYMIRGR